MAAKGKTKDNSPKAWRIPPLVREDHKYTRGHLLLLGGERMTGASRLAALAAQRVGAGMVTLAAAEKVWPVYAASLLSVVTYPLRNAQDWESLLDGRRIGTVLLGPGCEANITLRQAMIHTAQRELPLVLDAGALDVLADFSSIRRTLLGTPFLCTPHEGEYERLARSLRLMVTGDKVARARMLAEKLGGIVVLKGATTIIAAPDGRTVKNEAQAPQLATAGTGDVLAGMIAGLAAQGMELFDAACAATWLHTKAAGHFGHGMIAEDLLARLPAEIAEL